MNDTINRASEGPLSETGTVLPAILCVDNDPSILDGFRRNLRKSFRVHTAAGPGEGMDAINGSGPFAVVMSEYKMPGMDGIRFLAKVRAVAPDAVRIMLTGQADVAMAMAAVNQGNIFRFLLKPCTPLVLEKVLVAGLEEHRRSMSERHCMQETLLGCVQALVELLSTAQPEAFGRATRLRRYVREVAVKAGLTGVWQIEAAAMLCQIGLITLPSEPLAKAAFDEPFSAAARMLEKIPHLELVAKMIERQQVGYRKLPGGPAADSTAPEVLGSQVLKVAIAYDRLRLKGLIHDDALHRMRQDTGAHTPEILEAMTSIGEMKGAEAFENLPLSALSTGMILEEDLCCKNGMLLLGKGQEVTATFVQHLMNNSYGLPSDQLCKIRIRTSDFG